MIVEISKNNVTCGFLIHFLYFLYLILRFFFDSNKRLHYLFIYPLGFVTYLLNLFIQIVPVKYLSVICF